MPRTKKLTFSEDLSDPEYLKVFQGILYTTDHFSISLKNRFKSISDYSNWISLYNTENIPSEFWNNEPVDWETIKVHGGFTYSGPNLKIDNTETLSADGIFIGWNYNHYTDHYADYNGYFDDITLKQWTTEEIEYEAKLAIDQIIQKERVK